jgi:hypothetical protein
MGGELIVLADLSNVCALINSMAMICFTGHDLLYSCSIYTRINGHLETDCRVRGKEDRLKYSGDLLETISTIRQ